LDGSVTLAPRLDALLAEVREFLDAEQPEFQAAPWRGLIRIDGNLLICDEQGPYDFYEVAIEVEPAFPWTEPAVFEVGGRIPRTSDRHIFVDHGHCCVGVWDAWLAVTPDRSFAAFMRGPVADYFVGQSLVEAGFEWPYGERAHGHPGVLQAYADALGLDADAALVRAYLAELSRAVAKGHHRCPCGSGLRLRSCHLDQIRALRDRVEPTLARRMMGMVPSRD
jgi:hypothetical protein